MVAGPNPILRNVPPAVWLAPSPFRLSLTVVRRAEGVAVSGDGWIGMDPTPTRKLARRLVRTAEVLDGQIKSVSSTVRTLAWNGSAAERFRSEWTTVAVPAIRKAVDDLRTTGNELLRQADAQEAASAPGAFLSWT
jgi:hypothetical protein